MRVGFEKLPRWMNKNGQKEYCLWYMVYNQQKQKKKKKSTW